MHLRTRTRTRTRVCLALLCAALTALAATACDEGSRNDDLADTAPDTPGDTADSSDTSDTSDTAEPGDTGPDDTSADTAQLDTTDPGDASDTADADTTPDAEPDTVEPGWTVPTCTTVQGTGGVLITHDQGQTWSAATPPLTGIAYTTGLVALETPGRMLVVVADRLLRSDDAGCTWTEVGDLSGSQGLTRLTAGGGDRAWAWGDNRQFLVRIDLTDTETVLTTSKIDLPEVIGVGIDAVDPDHVVIGDHFGQLAVSTDGGATWTAQGVPANDGELAIGYRIAFAPGDPDRVHYAGATLGVRSSTDGGRTWVDAAGLAEAEGHPVNAFTVDVSPVDPDVVWAVALDVSIDLPNADRRLMRSTDGGRSFTEIGRESAEVTFSNSANLFVHPADANVAYIAWGTCYQAYGTDLFRYDAVGGMTKTHNPWHRLQAIAFSPADPDVLYLGVSTEGAGGAGTGCSG